MTRMTTERLSIIELITPQDGVGLHQELVAEIRAAWKDADRLRKASTLGYRLGVEDTIQTCLLPVERISFCPICNEENKTTVQEIKNAVKKIRAFAELKKERACIESPV